MKLSCTFCSSTISKKSPTTCYLNGKAFCDAECRRDYEHYGNKLAVATDRFHERTPAHFLSNRDTGDENDYKQAEP